MVVVHAGVIQVVVLPAVAMHVVAIQGVVLPEVVIRVPVCTLPVWPPSV